MHPNLFDEANGHLFIDETPLIPTTKDVILSCIVGIFFVLSHVGNLSMLTNTSFTLGLFHPLHAPNSQFWNKLASPTQHTMFINDFL